MMKTDLMRTAPTKIYQKTVPILAIMFGLGLFFLGVLTFSLPKKQKIILQKVPSAPVSTTAAQYAPDQLLVKFKVGVDQTETIAQAITLTSSKSFQKDQLSEEIELKAVQPVFLLTQVSAAATESMDLLEVNTAALVEKKKALDRWQKLIFNQGTDLTEIMHQLIASGNVEAVEFNYKGRQVLEETPQPIVIPDNIGGGNSYFPNDRYYLTTGTWGQSYPDQWGLHRIRVPAAWPETIGSNAVIVAVCDTGIDYTHPDLQGKIWINPGEIPNNGIDDDGNGFIDDVRGWDFGDGDNDPRDPYVHGTHIAGIIGAATNNSIGIAGMNWNVKLMAVKGYSDDGNSLLESDFANSILYAVDNGADIINISQIFFEPATLISDVIAYAAEAQVIVVAAAGNDNTDVAGFTPANQSSVITVAAWCPNNATIVTEDGISYCTAHAAGDRAKFSNYGDKIDVTAPGVDILSLYSTTSPYVPVPNDPYSPEGLYLRSSGTSMAAPHVAGIAALLRAIDSSISPETVKSILQQSAVDVLSLGRDIYSGYGLVDAAAAITLLQNLSAR